jgi:hypothetical protein
MSEYEYMDLFFTMVERSETAGLAFLTVVSSYLLVAYLVGEKLTKGQVILVSGLFFVGQKPPRRNYNIERLGRDRYRVDGRALISDLVEVMGVHIEAGMALTVGGMLIGCLRHLPADGDSVVVSGFRFRVESVTDRGVQTVLVEPD